MTPAREAFAVPLTFLTVVLIGAVRLTTPVAIVPPTLFSLVLGSILMSVFIQSGTLDSSRLVSGEPFGLGQHQRAVGTGAIRTEPVEYRRM